MTALRPQVLPPTAEALALAARILRAERLCAFPTETVYGLGGSALSADAIERIYRTKGRPSTNPLIVHVPDTDAARGIVTAWPDTAEALARRFFPGPLTLVLPRAAQIPAIVSAGLPTVAVRVPAHPVAQALLRAAELPLAAPSANRSEQISPTTAEHVARGGLPGLELVIDGGPCQFGIESTVVDLTPPRPRLLRPGAVPLQALRELLPELGRGAEASVSPDDEARPSPGMSRRHYAPRARLHLVAELSAVDPRAYPGPVGVLAQQPSAPDFGAACWEQLPADPEGYAADLYAALHRLDDAGVSTILVERPPAGEDWLAIHDRLSRASAA